VRVRVRTLAILGLWALEGPSFGSCARVVFSLTGRLAAAAASSSSAGPDNKEQLQSRCSERTRRNLRSAVPSSSRWRFVPALPCGLPSRRRRRHCLSTRCCRCRPRCGGFLLVGRLFERALFGEESGMSGERGCPCRWLRAGPGRDGRMACDFLGLALTFRRNAAPTTGRGGWMGGFQRVLCLIRGVKRNTGWGSAVGARSRDPRTSCCCCCFVLISTPFLVGRTVSFPLFSPPVLEEPPPPVSLRPPLLQRDRAQAGMYRFLGGWGVC
jgi:hypothetical protein